METGMNEKHDLKYVCPTQGKVHLFAKFEHFKFGDHITSYGNGLFGLAKGVLHVPVSFSETEKSKIRFVLLGMISHLSLLLKKQSSNDPT